jgi:acyl transferase domain-containing protein
MIGDPIELRALSELFHDVTEDRQFCGVGSVKTNIGHLLCAAGVAGFIKVVLSLYHKQLPPTLNCEYPNPRFDFETSPFYPNIRLSEWQPRNSLRRAGVSSFGFAGTNVHTVLSEFDPAQFTQQYKNQRRSLPYVQFNKRRFWIDREQSHTTDTLVDKESLDAVVHVDVKPFMKLVDETL